MSILNWINNAILALADPLLNWLLALPVNVALIIVSVGTGAIITFSRRFTTHQDLLRRCDQDKQRLKELIREAKARKDKEAVTRHRATFNLIGMTTMRQEGWPLLAAILPIAILGTWCFQRLAFVPPQANEPVAVHAFFPASAVGELVHIVPQEGLREESAGVGGGAAQAGHWIREIVEDLDPKTRKPVGGIATWLLAGEARTQPYSLEIRYKDSTVRKALLIGQKTYSLDSEFYDAAQPISCVQVAMKPVKLFGVVPGIPALLLPPWLVAYFLIAIPSVTLVKKVARIY